MENIVTKSMLNANLDHKETQGPRVGLGLSKDEASTILKRHKIGEKCKKLTYIDRGYNNRTYIAIPELECKDSSDMEYVIRLTGNFWTRMKTENEVASILYLSKLCQHQHRSHDLLPLPKIIGFCCDKFKSGIGCEYILMEKLNGVPLDEIFPELRLHQKKKVVEQVANILSALQSITFNQVGSLKFIDAVLGDTTGDGMGSELMYYEDLANITTSCIEVGPGLEAEAGPFQKYLEYLKVSCTTELRNLQKCPFLLEDDEEESVSQLILRIQKFVEVMCDPVSTLFTEDVYNVPFVFTHGDFEPRNMLVDNHTLEVTGLLDFEFSGSFPIDEDWFAGLSWIGVNTTEDFIFNEKDDTSKGNDANFMTEEIKVLKDHFLETCEAIGVAIPSMIPGHNRSLNKGEDVLFQIQYMPLVDEGRSGAHSKRVVRTEEES